MSIRKSALCVMTLCLLTGAPRAVSALDKSMSEAEANLSKGRSITQNGQPLQALPYFLKALKLLGPAPAKNQLLSEVSGELGQCYSDTGNYKGAEQFLKQAAAIALADKDYEFLAVYYNNIALLYSNNSQPTAALEFYGKCLNVLDKMPLEQGLRTRCLTENNMGLLYARGKQYQKALDMFLKALADTTKLPTDGTLIDLRISCLANMAMTYDCIKEPATAEEYALQAVDETVAAGRNKGSSYGYVKGQLGQIYLAHKKFKEAETELKIAIDELSHSNGQHVSDLTDFRASLKTCQTALAGRQ